MRQETWSEAKVYKRLAKVFPDGGYALLPHVGDATGLTQSRTCDAIVCSCWPSRGLWLAGVEIKVSRADWKRELAQPEKAHAINRYCKYWYVAAPEGVVPVNEVPDMWGLIECDATTAHITKKAAAFEAEPPKMEFVAAILRAAAKSIETATVHRHDEEVEALVEQRVAQEVRNALYSVEAERNRIKQHMELFAERSGIDISKGWNQGKIGDAVRVVLDSGYLDIQQRLEQFKTNLKLAADSIETALAKCRSGEIEKLDL